MSLNSPDRRRALVADGELVPQAFTYTPYRALVASTPLTRAKYIPNVLRKRVKIKGFHPPLPNTLRIGQPMNPAHVAGPEGRNGSLERLNSYQPPQIPRRGLEPHSPKPYTACPPLTSHPAVGFPANVAQSLPMLIIPPESSNPASCDHSSGGTSLTVDHAWKVAYQKCNNSLRRSKNRISRLTKDLSQANEDLCRAKKAQEKSELDAQLARCEVAILHEAVESVHQQDQLDIDHLKTVLAQSKRESKHLSLKVCDLEAAIQLLKSSSLSGTTLEVDELDLSSLEMLPRTVFRPSEPLKDGINRMPSALKVCRKPGFVIRRGHESPLFLETVAGPLERPDPSVPPPQSQVVVPSICFVGRRSQSQSRLHHLKTKTRMRSRSSRCRPFKVCWASRSTVMIWTLTRSSVYASRR
jgi:hypothetical protein